MHVIMLRREMRCLNYASSGLPAYPYGFELAHFH